MKKKLLVTLSLMLFLGVLFFNNTLKTDAQKQRIQYAKFLKEHRYHKTMYLSKKERRALGLPPNAYFEQEYLNEINPNTGKTHPENIFKVQQKLALEKKEEKFKSLESNIWIERGPNNVGGRTRAVLFDPNDATHKRVFAGGVSGGLWVNNSIIDSNSSWQQVGISENLAITCITVDPNNSQIMYVGTGESYTSDNGSGNGVWKSSDGGNSWTNVFNNVGSELNSKAIYINNILAWNNPATNKTEIFIGIGAAYYSAGNQWLGVHKIGLYKSINNGASWSQLTINTPKGTPYEPNDFEIGADNTLWMSTESNAYGHGGGTIFKSTDGNNFTVAHTLTDGMRTEIAVSKTDKDKIYVLAGGSSEPIIMIKTEDGFATTSNMTLPNDKDPDIPANDFTRGQAFYDLVIETDPNNDDILYVGGIDLFRSTNSGNSWSQMSKWHSGNSIQPYFLNENLGVPTVHADQHTLVFHPTDSNKAIFGNDGGVYYASSLSNAAENRNPNNFIVPRNKDYNTVQFYHGEIGQNTDFDMLLAGAQDNGTPFIQNAANNSFNASIDIFGGDGAYSFIDKDGDYLIASYVYNYKTLYTLPLTGNHKNLDDDLDTGSFINPQDLDDNLDILYANKHSFDDGGYYSILRYKGIKASEVLLKEQIEDDLLNDIVTALKVSPFTTTSTTLIAGLQNGKLLKITDANTTTPVWSSIGSSSFVGSISSIAFGRTEDEILVTFHNYGVSNVWYTANGGATWQDKEGNLPDIPVKAILMNPLNNNEVIIGTELGAWSTNNFTETPTQWIQSNNGMSNVKVTSLNLRKVDNTILATTYGRGLFTSKFTEKTASLDKLVAATKTFTVYPTISKGNFTILAKSSLGKVTIYISEISGRQVYQSKVDFSKNKKQAISLDVKTGIYLVNLVDQNNKKSTRKIVIK